MCEEIADLTGQLVETIQAQRDLNQAEAGDLKLHPEEVHVPALVDAVRLEYCKHSIAKRRTIIVGNAWEGVVVTDRRLLQRVLENMLKNALEATAPGNTVTISCEEQPDERCVLRPQSLKSYLLMCSYNSSSGLSAPRGNQDGVSDFTASSSWAKDTCVVRLDLSAKNLTGQPSR